MGQTYDNICDIELPGYTLVNRIGAGGYGEVWLAEAPGGLTKAVKFIFGYHNEKRAERELRSLEKIKQVRHPFLLSLERIEVIAGRLVIVSELAEGCLKDRFDECAAEGMPGIPRTELIGYLRDAADALDFLRDRFSLQHLDVKPENLLLLAGHVKVADFGLVKEVENTQASLVGGMTPRYSAPEVFQGEPGVHSDQYSLAMVYQELLTGKFPFGGVTSAELTLQHMHDEPDLSSLPLEDRYVLARALSKRPDQRFANCSEMIAALAAAKCDTISASATVFAPGAAPFSTKSTYSRPVCVTEFIDDEMPHDAAAAPSLLLDIPIARTAEAGALLPREIAADTFEPTPTLVVGIGGAAGEVLHQLRKRISQRFDGRDVPAMPMLLVDTDLTAILASQRGEPGEVLTNEETLTLALRRPQEYGEQSKRIMSWLSRRWLYNIPKSLRTEGLRPLGRLAFVDHARRSIQRIRMALQQAVSEESRKTSAEATGLSFRGDSLRVVLVASVSGGTGGGMSLDVGYAIRALLEKLELKSVSTTGIFLHATGRDSRRSDLAKVNTFSWLTEYNHFHRPGGVYAGDESCGLPAHPPGTAAFDDAYLVHLGNGLSDEDFAEQSAALADYLYLDCWTAAHEFFAASRSVPFHSDDEVAPLRSLGIHTAANETGRTLDVLVDQLSHQVVLGWSGSPAPNSTEARTGSSVRDTDQIVSGAPLVVSQLQLGLEGLSAKTRSIIEGRFGNQVEPSLAKIRESLSKRDAASQLSELIHVIDGMFAPQNDAEDSQTEYVLDQSLQAVVRPLGMKLVADLQRWLLSRLDLDQQRLAGAQSAAEWFTAHFRRVGSDSQRLAQGIRAKLVERAQAAGTATPSKTCADPLDEAMHYFRLLLDLRAVQATTHLVRLILAELKNIEETIVEFGRHLRHLADTVDHPEISIHELPQSVVGKLLEQMPEMCRTVDAHLQEQHLNPQGGLFATVMGNAKVVSELLEALRKLSRREVQGQAEALACSNLEIQQTEQLTSLLQSATPEFCPAAAALHTLCVVPSGQLTPEQSAQLRAGLGRDAWLLPQGEGKLTVCREAVGLSLPSVAVELIEQRRDFLQLAARVHTRSDVSWTSLMQAPATTPNSSPEQCTLVLE